jgi:hypothetical protein
MIIMHDTTGYHEGSTLVMRNLRTLVDHHGLAGVGDLCIVNGEGTLHHSTQRTQILLEKCLKMKNRGCRVFLVNTLWQDNGRFEDYLDLFSGVWCRESLSAGEIRSSGREAFVAPDLALWGTRHRLPVEYPEVLIDSVDQEISSGLEASSIEAEAPFLKMCERDDVERHIRSAGLVHTGRFHGCILCIKHGTPFIAYPSNSHKIEGLMKDLGCSMGDVVTEETMKDYRIRGRLAIKSMFLEIADRCGIGAPQGNLNSSPLYRKNKSEIGEE